MADNQVNINPAASTFQDAGGTDNELNSQFDDVRADLRTRFELLPEDIKKVIVDENYQVGLFNIAKEKKLTYEELGMLETETTMVLLGMTKPEDYRGELQTQLKKDDATMDAIVKAVNDQVFTPIRASIQKIYSAPSPESYIPESLQKTVPIETPAAQANPAPKVAAVNPIPAAPQPSLTSTEKNVLEKTGVILSDAPKPTTPSPAVGSLPPRDDLLKSIENPPKTPMINIVADKLANAAPVIPAVKKTDYSMPKPGGNAPLAPTTPSTPAAPAAPAAKTADPYREPIS